MTINGFAVTIDHQSKRREERVILIVTCLAAFLFFNSFGSISVALPAIQQQFGNSLTEIQWITLIGVVTIASLSFCFGRLGTRWGQRLLYKLGVLLYALGAGLGAIAQSFLQLLLARAVMAIGLALALPMSTAILAASFAPQQRGRALGLFASAIAVGRMTGPTIGGFLLELGGWSWIFGMNFTLGLVISLAVFGIFPGAGARRYEPFDGFGAASLLIGYPALLIGLTFGESLGWSSPAVLAAFLLAAAGLVAFIWIELNHPHALIDLRIFKRPMLTGALATVILSHMIYHPIALCAPLFLQNSLNVSPVSAGLLLALLPLSTALASPLSGRGADRYPPATVALAGLMIIVSGIGFYAVLDLSSGLVLMGAALALIGAGVGVFTPANQKVAFGAVEQEEYGVLSALLSSFGTAAGTIGITMTVALMEASGGTRLWTEPEVLSQAQRFAFACLLPIGVLAIMIGALTRGKGLERVPAGEKGGGRREG
jgi:EmrB/QacA subfamily drug resistance transporter